PTPAGEMGRRTLTRPKGVVGIVIAGLVLLHRRGSSRAHPVPGGNHVGHRTNHSSARHRALGALRCVPLLRDRPLTRMLRSIAAPREATITIGRAGRNIEL